MLRIAALAMTMLSVTPLAQAQAFGVKMGTPIGQFGNAKMISDDGPQKQYSVPTLPSPHSEFETYTLSATAAQGICSVMGVGKDHAGDRNGTSIKSTFEELKTALISKYGEGREFNYLQASSIWDEPQDFAMSLRQKERTLSYFWVADAGTVLPKDLSGIILTASATDSSTTYLRLTYQFANFEACESEQAKRDNRGL
jgi:hypothetical protein